jgi:hypothetical protein
MKIALDRFGHVGKEAVIELTPKNCLTFKIWIAHIVDTDQIILPQHIIGHENYWLTQFIDDHKNKRIDPEAFYE